MTRRLAILFGLYVAAILAAALIFSFEEGKTFGDGLWWACVTATTVGYGDVSPTTLVGRFTAVVLMHATTLCMLPLLTAEIAAKLIVNSDAFTHTEQEEIKVTLRRIAERMDCDGGVEPAPATVRPERC